MSHGVVQTTEPLIAEVTSLRHELHQHPEIRFEEKWTSDRIAHFLEEAGIPFERGYAGGTGIVATLKGGPGPTVALRADMDALEITEETGLPYASKLPNRMHACGHDGHTAVLCGTAKALAQHLQELPGSVKFIFQPGEEIAGGGKYMVEEGAVNDADAVFGLHGWPDLAVGQVGSRPGWLMAGARDFFIRVRGAGCHGAAPSQGIDPVHVAAHIITALQSIVSRETDPCEAAVVTVAILRAGEATNVIPDSAQLAGTMRAISQARMDQIRESVSRIAINMAAAFRAEADVTFGEVEYPPLYNDPEMTAFADKVVRETLGPEQYVELEHPNMAAEDFAFYLSKKPGAFLYLGVNPDPSKPYPHLHSPRYNFSDEAVPVGMTLLSSLAVRFLESQPQ